MTQMSQMSQMSLPSSYQLNKKRKEMETTRKHVTFSLHETKKVVSDEPSTSTQKKRASASDYSGLLGAKSHAMEHAEEIQANLAPKFPSMIKLMLPSHVSGGFWLGLPKRFCDMFMPSEDTMFTLEDEKGGKSKSKYLPHKVGLSGGWKGFSIMHKLAEGDVVIFQLVKPAKFKVYIVRSNSLENPVEILALPNLESSATPINHGNTQDVEIQNATCENVTEDDLGSEALEASITISESIIHFKDVKKLENFTVSVDGLILDPLLPKHVKTKYYDLCLSQKLFLHKNLIEGLNCNLAAGIICETVNIADAIKSCKISVSEEHLSTWDKTLKAFEDMGMNVGFLREKLGKLVGIDSEAKNCRDACREKVAKANEEMSSLQEKLLQVKNTAKRLDAEIENMALISERHDLMFQQEVDAPW